VHKAVVTVLVAGTLLTGPAAYAVQTASTSHTGALPTAGPASSTGGAGGFGGGRGGPGGQAGPGGTRGGAGTPPGGTTSTTNGTGTPSRGGFPGAATNSGTGGTGGFGGARGGGMGGLGGASTVASALQKALTTDAAHYSWVAATTSDNEAASLELASGGSVMSLGGYNGTDDAITLSAFEKLVAAGKIHYYVADSQGFIGSTSASSSTAYAIQQWVAKTYTATTIGGSTVYDLTATR
jgi:hypothetical protein